MFHSSFSRVAFLSIQAWCPSVKRYEAGYDRGYSGEVTAGGRGYGAGSIHIGSDNNVTWQAPSNARVFVRVDNGPEKLFAEGSSGTQVASWVEQGHLYVFMLRDMNGREIARDRLDLRSRPRYQR